MNSEILIHITPRDTRIALVNESILQEIFIERNKQQRLVGNIYKGRVERVLPGMQAAFIDIGLERTAYLHETEMYIENEQNINSALRAGQELLVQVITDPINDKGAKLTTQLSISTRNLAYVPALSRNSISAKINDAAERARLMNLLEANTAAPQQGFIVRTNAEGATELSAEQNYLVKLWQKINTQSKFAKVGELVFAELTFTMRILREFISKNISRIIVDDIDHFAECQKFLSDHVSDFHGNLELYNDSRPLFDLYNINNEIQRALSRKLLLKSGAYLLFDHTEAMTTIDVNSGAYVGEKDLTTTALQINLEAIPTICKQLRLRNLGGIIIIDFIDMHAEDYKQKILTALEQELKHDSVKITCHGFTKLGLVELTRKRTHETLQHGLCTPCIACHGRGFVPTEMVQHD